MISRRHIRLKVLQSLYSFAVDNSYCVDDAIKKIRNQFHDIFRLQLTLISFLIQLAEYADLFLNQQKHKNFPSEADINPNRRFINNSIIQWLISTKNLRKKIGAVNNIWQNDDYDIIILDPPAFAKHQKARHKAIQGYKRLNARAIEQIKPGGIIFTFSCSQVISKELFRNTILSASIAAEREIKILHQLHQPADHPINIFHPESEYLKGLVIQVF